jgi:hypothetical protein
MAFATVGAMLDYAKEFESTLEAFLADVRDRAANDNVRLLTYYLSRFKRHIAGTLDLFTTDQLVVMREVPLKSIDSEFVVSRCFDGTYLSREATADELLETAIELTDIILCFYQWLINQPANGVGAGVFEQLAAKEEKNIQNLRALKENRKFVKS